MEMVIESLCDVCGQKGERRFGSFSPSDRLPDRERWDLYLPEGWRYVEGVTMCPKHSCRVVIERVAQPGNYFHPRLEIENVPGEKAQLFQFGKYPSASADLETRPLCPETLALLERLDEDMRKIGAL